MRVSRFDGKGTIDIRRVRRLIRRYVDYWRKKAKEHGYPDTPIDNAAMSPAKLIRKFRRDMEYRTRRQHHWNNVNLTYRQRMMKK